MVHLPVSEKGSPTKLWKITITESKSPAYKMKPAYRFISHLPFLSTESMT